MKKIFKTFIEYELNGKTTGHFTSRWKYGEIPKEETRFFSFDDLPYQIDFSCKYSFFKKRYTKARLLYDYDISTNQKNFKSASVTTKPFIIDLKKISVTELAEKLSASDFIEWCKDNNIPANLR